MAKNEKRPSTTCDNMEQDLVLYYYHELQISEQSNIELHLKDCEGCRLYLDEMASILPLTVTADEPPQAFWDRYSREMRQKLADAREKQSWWRKLASLFQPWPVPAIATAAVVALALSFTIGKGFRPTQEAPPDDEALMEVLPLTENLDFFKNMEVLDAMDVLEQMSSSETT